MIVYKKGVWESLLKAGYDERRLRREKILCASTIDGLKRGAIRPMPKTVGKICRLLNCTPERIVKY